LTRHYASTNAVAVREHFVGLANTVRHWGASGGWFQYTVGLTVGSWIESAGGLVSATLVDPMSTVEGIGTTVSQYYERGGVIGVAAGMTGAIGFYESYSGIDYLSGEMLNGDERFDRAWSASGNLLVGIGTSGIAHSIARNGIQSALKAGVRGAPKGAVLQSSRRAVWADSFGKPSEGLGQLVRDLPKGHEARLGLARMLREIRASGGAVSNRNLTGGVYAQFSGFKGVHTALFEYQPSKLRIADLLEEQVHWQQITTGQHMRTYRLQSMEDVMEILAKQRVLQHPELTPVLRMEWLDDLARVRAGAYGRR
jgi:hypothetical protein